MFGRNNQTMLLGPVDRLCLSLKNIPWNNSLLASATQLVCHDRGLFVTIPLLSGYFEPVRRVHTSSF